MLASALVLAVGCSPNLLGKLQDREVPGPGVTLRQTFTNPGVSLSLVDAAGTVRWVDAKASAIEEPAAFGEGGVVAMKGGFGVVRLYDAAGKRHEVKVLPLVTSDEHDFIPSTSCGLEWLDGLRFEGATLVVSIRQRTWPLEGSPDVLPSIELLVDAATKKVTRRAPEGPVTVPALLAAWRAEPGRRVDLARLLRVKAKHRRSDKALAAFLKEQVAQVKEQPLLGLLQGALDELPGKPAKR